MKLIYSLIFINVFKKNKKTKTTKKRGPIFKATCSNERKTFGLDKNFQKKKTFQTRIS